jgi:hypothetical protein
MGWGPPEQSKIEGKPFPRPVQKRRGKSTPPPPPRDALPSFLPQCGAQGVKEKLLPNEKYRSPSHHNYKARTGSSH